MFSSQEKQFIAGEIEKILLKLDHPEMPKEKPSFELTVVGKDEDSWAEIEPNWVFGKHNPSGINPYNELSREIHKRKKE